MLADVDCALPVLTPVEVMFPLLFSEPVVKRSPIKSVTVDTEFTASVCALAVIVCTFAEDTLPTFALPIVPAVNVDDETKTVSEFAF